MKKVKVVQKRLKTAVRKKKTNTKSFGKFCHDLKNPLTTIKINLDMLVMSKEYKKITPKLKNFVKSIEKEVEKIIEMLS